MAWVSIGEKIVISLLGFDQTLLSEASPFLFISYLGRRNSGGLPHTQRGSIEQVSLMHFMLSTKIGHDHMVKEMRFFHMEELCGRLFSLLAGGFPAYIKCKG